MKKVLGIILAVVVVSLGAVVVYGIKSAMDKAAQEAAEREAANAAADAEEKLAAYCSDMRRETRELKRRASKIEELIEDKRTCELTPDGRRNRNHPNIDIGAEGLRQLQKKNPAEFNWRTNVIASWGAARVSAFHEGFERRLELLDSVSAYSMSTLESVSHDYYRELFSLDGKLKELMIVKASKDRSLDISDDGINEAYAKAMEDLPGIRAKMHEAYDKERELLLSKIVKTVVLSENMRSNAVEFINAIIAATSAGTLTEHLQSIESTTNALPAQALQIALHRSCTNCLTAIDAIANGKLRPKDIGFHNQYRKSLVMKDEWQERYLTTRINALLNKPEGESVATALEKIRDQQERTLRDLNNLNGWFGELTKRERQMLLLKAAESLGLTDADVDDFVSTVTDLIGALGTPPM